MTRLTSTMILLGILLVGCATPNFKRAATANQSAAAFRTGVIELQQTTEWSQSALKRFASLQDTDPHLAYLQLQNSTATLESRSQHMADLSHRLRARIAAYYDQWQQELPTIQDAEIRQASAHRRTVLIDTYNQIPPLVTQARQQSQAYVAQLHDMEKYLGNDLTPAGIQSAASFIDKSNQAGTKLQADLDALLKELDAVSAALAPAPR